MSLYLRFHTGIASYFTFITHSVIFVESVLFLWKRKAPRTRNPCTKLVLNEVRLQCLRFIPWAPVLMMDAVGLCIVSLLLFGSAALVQCRPPSCKRRAPRGSDCTTRTGECEMLYNSSHPYDYIAQLPHTPAK